MQPQSNGSGNGSSASTTGLLEEILQATTESIGVVEAQSRAEMAQQSIAARKFRRDFAKVKQAAIVLATFDTETAMSCFYTVPRGGKSVTGPSIRLAEIVAAAWGNLRVTARIVEISSTYLVVQASACDVEVNNIFQSDVRRNIVNKRGERYNEDMITTTANAAIAIAQRNAIFKVVPGAFVDSIEREVRKYAAGEGKQLQERLGELVKKLEKLGTTQPHIRRYLNIEKWADAQPEDLIALVGAFNAIRDGESTVEEIFGGAKVDAKLSAAEKIGKKLAENDPTKTEPTKPAAKPTAADQSYDEVLAPVPWMNDLQRVGVKKLAQEASIAAVDLAAMINDASDADEPSKKLAEFMAAAAAKSKP